MMLDKQNYFCDAKAYTFSSTTAQDSENAVDISAVRDLAAGEPMSIIVQVDVALSAAQTITVTLVSDDNASLSSDTTRATLFTIPNSTAAGTRFRYDIPEGLTYERYLGLVFTPNGSVNATLTAFICPRAGLDSVTKLYDAVN